MTYAQVNLLVTLTEINCGECGGVYAINERYRKQREEYGNTWHCPYCQVSWGYAKSALKIEMERHQATLARFNETEAENRRLVGKLKRVQRGVCPQCNRTFENLARHMKCKHNN